MNATTKLWLRRIGIILGVSVLLALLMAAVGGTDWADTFRTAGGGRGPHGPGAGEAGWAWLRPLGKELLLIGAPLSLVAVLGRRRVSRAARSPA